MTKPTITAQRRSPVKRVPTRKGRLRRERPSPCAPCRTVVITIVAVRPHINMLQNPGRAAPNMSLAPALRCFSKSRRGIDQAHMRERLGEVAKRRAALHVDLLGEKAK